MKQGSLAAFRQAVNKARALNSFSFLGPHSPKGTQRREDPTEPPRYFVKERESTLLPG